MLAGEAAVVGEARRGIAQRAKGVVIIPLHHRASRVRDGTGMAGAIIVIIPRYVVGANLADETVAIDIIVPDRVGLVRGHPRQTTSRILVVLRYSGPGRFLGAHPVAVVGVDCVGADGGIVLDEAVPVVPDEGVAAGGAVGAVAAGLVAAVVKAVVSPGGGKTPSAVIAVGGGAMVLCEVDIFLHHSLWHTTRLIDHMADLLSFH